MAMKERGKIIAIVMLAIFVIGAMEGLVLASYIPANWISGVMRLPLVCLLSLILFTGTRWGRRRVDSLERKRANYLCGVRGEVFVGRNLEDLPEDFFIINDLATLQGNLDHVVIGPTGVFILDTKNWRGVVKADTNGELLLNDKPTDGQEIQQFTARLMGIREKIQTLAPGTNQFFQGLFVFTSARVEAKWGTTKSVRCITDEQLIDHILDDKSVSRIQPTVVNAIAKAFGALKTMEQDFGANSLPTPPVP